MKFLSNRFIAFSYRDFRLIWGSQLISVIGTQMQIVAIAWHIYLLTHSPISLGLIGLAGTIPLLIFSLYAGVFADKHDRKMILIISQLAAAVFAFILGIATYIHFVNAWLIYLITALTAVANAFSLPASQAFVPKLVDRKHLPNALSMNFIMRQTGMVIGPAIAGLLIAKYGVGLLYLLNSLSFFAVIIALLFVRTKGNIEKSNYFVATGSITEGLRFVKSKTIIWSTMMLDFISNFFASATSLLPIYAKDILNVGPQGLGFLYAAPSIGAIFAGFLVSHSDRIKKQGRVIIYSVLLYGIGTIIFGLSKTLTVSLLALGLVGAGDSISTIMRNVIRQLETPDHIRGRMTSINMIFFMGGPQLGELEAGMLAAVIGAPLSVVSGGVATILSVGIIAFVVPGLWNYKTELQPVS